MALLLPCANEINAHLLRSLLLSHGIPSDVIHDASATAYGNWIMRPQLLISEEALDDGLELLAVPDEPLDDHFIEPAETAELSEDLGHDSTVPGFIPLVAFGLIAGFLLGVADLIPLTFFAMMKGGRGSEGTIFLPLWMSLYGTVFGIACWPWIVFARSCHRREDGSLPLRARLVALFLPQNPLGYVALGLVWIIIQMLLRLTSAAL